MKQPLEFDKRYTMAHFNAIMENSPTSMQIYSLEGVLKAYNRAFEQLFDIDGATIVEEYNILCDPQLEILGVAPLLKRTIQGEAFSNIVTRYDATSRGGRARWLRTSVFPIHDSEDRVIDFVVMHEDITDLKDQELYLENQVKSRTLELEKANRELERLARLDELTALNNRRVFNEVMTREIGNCIATEKSMALMVMDIDNFKQYNDTYGHLSGDLCLQKIAYCIQEHAQRSSDTIVRYGGEEFAIIMANTRLEDAKRIADKIRQSIMALKIPHHPSLYGVVTLSIGIAAFNPKAPHWECELHSKSLIQLSNQIFETADQSLYRAKGEGKNCICIG